MKLVEILVEGDCLVTTIGTTEMLSNKLVDRWKILRFKLVPHIPLTLTLNLAGDAGCGGGIAHNCTISEGTWFISRYVADIDSADMVPSDHQSVSSTYGNRSVDNDEP